MVGLLERIQSIGHASRLTADYLEVIDVLTYLRDSKSEILVSFKGETDSHPSIISAINPKHRVMLINNSMPISPFLLRRGRPVVVDAKQQNREIRFRSKFLEPFVPDTSFGYQLEIPEFLGITQPRVAFRVLINGVGDLVNVTLLGTENQMVNGVLKNISKMGLGIKTEADLPSELLEKHQTLDCKISLEGRMEINCRMEIRNVHDMATGENGKFIGGMMREISKKDSLKLEHFIEKLQRQRILAYA